MGTTSQRALKASETTELVERLRKLASKEAIFKDLCKVWAKRERARGSVTLPAMKAYMVEAGYQYTKQDCANALEKLAGIGLGTLERDVRGRAKALKDIQVTFQSLGKAVLTPGTLLERYTPERKYADISDVTDVMPSFESVSAQVQNGAASVARAIEGFSATLTGKRSDGKPFNIQIPSSMSAREISDFVANLVESLK